MTSKEYNLYLNKGYPKKVLDDTVAFLKCKNATLYNLALLGTDYRIMYKTEKGVVNAQLFPIPVS